MLRCKAQSTQLGWLHSAARFRNGMLARLLKSLSDEVQPEPIWLLGGETEQHSQDFDFFADIKQFVNRGCQFYRRRAARELSKKKIVAEKKWLRDELTRLRSCDVYHEKAITLQALLMRHNGEWLVFLDDARVSPGNNLAERALDLGRPS